jgi:hypothetical protein
MVDHQIAHNQDFCPRKPVNNFKSFFLIQDLLHVFPLRHEVGTLRG